LRAKDIPYERADTALGATFTVVTASVLVIVAGTLLYGKNIDSAAAAARLLIPMNAYIGTFVAIGLFDAGLLGAIAISMTSAWAFGEVFGWSHSLNAKKGQSRGFTLFRLLVLVFAASIVLIPGAPLVTITLFVQVIAVTLLPAALMFLILLLNEEEVVGKYKNTRLQNILSGSIVGVIIILSTLYGLGTLFPGIFG
jgi:Mn2+/Fe2+ NRAMP family transporter